MSTYFSSRPTGVNAEREVCKAIVAVHRFARLVLQSQPTGLERGDRFHFDSQCGHCPIGVTRWQEIKFSILLCNTACGSVSWQAY